jgi:hypothetical protein
MSKPNPSPGRTAGPAARCALAFAALGLAAAAQAGIEPQPFIDWSKAHGLRGSGPLGDDPRVIFGFNPQPEPPRLFTQELGLGEPAMPSITNRGDFGPGSVFEVLMAIGNGGALTLQQMNRGGYPPDPIRTIGFDVFDAAGRDLFDVFLDFDSSSGGALDGATAVAFNPQPEPPAGFGADSDFGVAFTFTSFSDVTVRLRMFDPQGNAIVFQSVGEPAALALVGIGLIGLRVGRRGAWSATR